MKRLGVVMLALAFAMMLSNTAQAGDWKKIDLGGTIVDVGDDGIALAIETRKRDRKIVRISVVDRTIITRNGERARLRSLQVRDKAKVRAVIQKSRRGYIIVAYEIHARGR